MVIKKLFILMIDLFDESITLLHQDIKSHQNLNSIISVSHF